MEYSVKARDAVSLRVIKGLQAIYKNKVRALEDATSFAFFERDAITDKEMEAKSQVLVIGPYSTGKTTFIRHLLGRDFKSMNIGPEPTTDNFCVVMHGEEDASVHGNSFSLINDLPYAGLQQFGTGFLKRLTATISPAPILEHITLIDTPGVLSGEQQQFRRSYSFPDVTRWFADRSDMIILLFDAHKLDISDELREVMVSLIEHQDKVRIVLNKADQVDRASLMRVYGSLMWSLGTIFPNPEVVRVFVGSFWDKELKHSAHEKLFARDQSTLLEELAALPHDSAVRKIDHLMSRVKRLKAHACLVGHLRSQMPMLAYQREAKKQELLRNLASVYDEVKMKYGLHHADMPKIDKFKDKLASADFGSFPAVRGATLQQLDDVIKTDIPQVMLEAGGADRVFKYTVSQEALSDSSTPKGGSALNVLRSLWGGGSDTAAGAQSSSSAAAAEESSAVIDSSTTAASSGDTAHSSGSSSSSSASRKKRRTSKSAAAKLASAAVWLSALTALILALFVGAVQSGSVNSHALPPALQDVAASIPEAVHRVQEALRLPHFARASAAATSGSSAALTADLNGRQDSWRESYGKQSSTPPVEG